MVRRKPRKIAKSPGNATEGCLGCLALLLIVIGAVFMIAVPPLGIAVLLLGSAFCLILSLYKTRKPNKETEQEKLRHQAKQVIVAYDISLKAAGCRPPDSNLCLDEKLSGKTLGQQIDIIEKEYVKAKAQMDAVARKATESKSHRATVKLDTSFEFDDWEKRATAFISQIQKEGEILKSQIVEYDEWIEITGISGKKRVYCVGKPNINERQQCHCFRLYSNPDIIKVGRYSTEYPYDLIDTKGAQKSQHEFFEQVSFDKKTNTEKSKTKTLISWRLFGRKEFEEVYLPNNR
jgi:hypothetical protein